MLRNIIQHIHLVKTGRNRIKEPLIKYQEHNQKKQMNNDFQSTQNTYHAFLKHYANS